MFADVHAEEAWTLKGVVTARLLIYSGGVVVVVVHSVPRVSVVVPTVSVTVGWAGVKYEVAEAVTVNVPGVEER